MRSSSPWLYVASDPARVPDPGTAPPQGVLVKVAFRVFIVLGKPQNKPQVLELSRNKCKKYAQYREDYGVLAQDTQYCTVQ